MNNAKTSIERKPMIPNLLRYQGFAVEDYGFTLDAFWGILDFRSIEVGG
jgi:hypothetical protein